MLSTLRKLRYEIKKSSGARTKNQFQWNKMRGKNTISFGVGYDSYQAALKAVRSENRQRKTELPIYHRGKLVK